MKKKNLVIIMKGLIVGGTMMVPGVSGGTMAMILGIYDRLISSVSSFMKHKRESSLFLILFALGGLAGMFLFARPLLYLIQEYPMPMRYFFLGAVAGGLPIIVKKAQLLRASLKSVACAGMGLAAVLAISAMPSGGTQVALETGIIGFLFLMAAGFVAAVALVLPGISVSYLLLIMNLYDETMYAVSKLYLPFLVPLGLGLILGIVLTTKGLEKAMIRHPQATYMVIFGFVLGSMQQVFPGVPSGFPLIICLVMLGAGFAAIQLIQSLEKIFTSENLKSN